MAWQAWHGRRAGKAPRCTVEVVSWSPAPLPPTGTIPNQDPDPQPTPAFTFHGLAPLSVFENLQSCLPCRLPLLLVEQPTVRISIVPGNCMVGGGGVWDINIGWGGVEGGGCLLLLGCVVVGGEARKQGS